MALRISAVDVSYKRIKEAVTSQRTSYNLHAKATDDHGLCTTTLLRPVELLLHCRRPYWAAMVTLRRIHCSLIRMPSDGVRLSILKVRGISQRSMQSHSIYCRCYCVAAVMLVIILRTPLHFSWTPWDRCENIALV